MKLTNKQEKFAQEVASGKGQAEAYRIAYPRSKKWKDSAVWSQASRLMANSAVSARVEELKKIIADKACVDAAYVLSRLVEIDQMDVADILNDDGSFKSIRLWPKIWRQFISGVDMAEMYEGRGDDRQIVGVLKKIKWPDKVKNLELIGKHLAVGAFVERIDLSSKDGSMTPKGLDSFYADLAKTNAKP